jgi:hypothetical protein
MKQFSVLGSQFSVIVSQRRLEISFADGGADGKEVGLTIGHIPV